MRITNTITRSQTFKRNDTNFQTKSVSSFKRSNYTKCKKQPQNNIEDCYN